MQTHGKFITLEGGEGSGKSTQVALLADWLREQGINVVTTREPGGTPAAEAIRGLLVDGATDCWQLVSEVLLHNAARAEHLVGLIAPTLERGDWVISDRYADSTMAYQGYGHGVDHRVIDDIHRHVAEHAGHRMPDLTLVLDIPVEIGLARAGNRQGMTSEDRYERMGAGFHERVRQGFLEIARNAPERCKVIDARPSPAAVSQALIDTAVPHLVARRLEVGKQ